MIYIIIALLNLCLFMEDFLLVIYVNDFFVGGNWAIAMLLLTIALVCMVALLGLAATLALRLPNSKTKEHD